jgi:hypothetical protein
MGPARSGGRKPGEPILVVAPVAGEADRRLELVRTQRDPFAHAPAAGGERQRQPGPTGIAGQHPAAQLKLAGGEQRGTQAHDRRRQFAARGHCLDRRGDRIHGSRGFDRRGHGVDP